MRTLGGCAVLVGVLELLNAIMAATAVGRGGSGIGMMLMAAGGVVSALLLASGIALLMRPRNAIGFARASALACLIAFALFAALRPGFSMASMLTGIVFPIVMLVVIARRGAGQRAAAAH